MRYLLLLLLPLSMTRAEGWSDARVQALRYDRVTWLCTHNAFAARADRFIFPNQTHGLRRQLEDGVRALMLDVHRHEGQLRLIHGKPWLGKRPLADGLAEVAAFLKANPRAVVTLILESYADGPALARAFAAAGLAKQAHAQGPGAWPTVGAMVEAGKRLVVLTNRGGGHTPWLLPVWRHAFDTPWKARSLDDLRKVDIGRGKPDRALLIMNHFLGSPLPSRKLSAQANARELLTQRIARVRETYRRAPSFVVLDFYELGDAREVVNGMQPR